MMGRRLLGGFFILVASVWGTWQASTAWAATEGTTVVYLPVVRSSDPSVSTGPEWLAKVNDVRAQADLPLVEESAEWSEGAWLHSRYMVKTDIIDHAENPENKWYTPAGATAAEASVLVVSFDEQASDGFAIEAWMQAPFHAVGILDPRLRSVGYGSYREGDGGYQMGATLDVIRGLDNQHTSTNYPIAWPGDGKDISMTYFWGEYPDPLSSCPGYSTPSGLPIILQIGSGSKTPSISSHSFSNGSTELEHCIFDEKTYSNPNDSYGEWLGRAILDARDAIVLIPRDPLVPGASYTVSITANKETTTWTFSVLEQQQSTQTRFADLPMSQVGRGNIIPR